jgi:hypothetical protein
MPRFVRKYGSFRHGKNVVFLSIVNLRAILGVGTRNTLPLNVSGRIRNGEMVMRKLGLTVVSRQRYRADE